MHACSCLHATKVLRTSAQQPCNALCRYINVNANGRSESRSLENTAPSTPTFVQFATPFGSPVQQQSRSGSPRTSWFGGKSDGVGRSRFSVSETGERTGGLQHAWRRVVAFVTCSKF